MKIKKVYSGLFAHLTSTVDEYFTLNVTLVGLHPRHFSITYVNPIHTNTFKELHT
jgi:hypothetical protein